MAEEIGQRQEEMQPKEMQEETREEERGGGSFFGPEAVIMLPIAVLLDVLGLLEFIPIVGNIISLIADLIGVIFIGGWLFFRSGTIQATPKAAARFQKTARVVKWLRPLAFIGEFIPYVGILPLWTLLVFFELQES